MVNVGVIEFSGLHQRCSWTGIALTSADIEDLAGRIRERTLDFERGVEVAELLLDLASTGMAEDFVKNFLAKSDDEEVKHWQVGEALAEALLEDGHSVMFPWNTRRDERTIRASLPGADLVGLSTGPVEDAMLVFGEVKSSADTNNPPQVVYGKSGLVQQLEHLVDNAAIQFKLIRWLEARVPLTESERFECALANFVNSQGTGLRIIGCLVRDTMPSETDVVERGRKLGALVQAPGQAELLVWYMPISMDDWPSLAAA